MLLYVDNMNIIRTDVNEYIYIFIYICNRWKLQEISNTIFEKKNTLDGINSRLGTEKDRVNELQATYTIQNKAQVEKKEPV